MPLRARLAERYASRVSRSRARRAYAVLVLWVGRGVRGGYQSMAWVRVLVEVQARRQADPLRARRA